MTEPHIDITNIRPLRTNYLREWLPIEEPGWITMQEANALFSPMETAYAFGEMDEVGKANLAAFAAAARRCHFEFMPIEGRLYFMHKANTNARADEA